MGDWFDLIIAQPPSIEGFGLGQGAKGRMKRGLITSNVSVCYHQPRWRMCLARTLLLSLLIWELVPEAPSPAVTQLPGWPRIIR